MTMIETMLRGPDATTGPTRKDAISSTDAPENTFADVLAGASTDRGTAKTTGDSAEHHDAEHDGRTPAQQPYDDGQQTGTEHAGTEHAGTEQIDVDTGVEHDERVPSARRSTVQPPLAHTPFAQVMHALHVQNPAAPAAPTENETLTQMLLQTEPSSQTETSIQTETRAQTGITAEQVATVLPSVEVSADSVGAGDPVVAADMTATGIVHPTQIATAAQTVAATETAPTTETGEPIDIVAATADAPSESPTDGGAAAALSETDRDAVAVASPTVDGLVEAPSGDDLGAGTQATTGQTPTELVDTESVSTDQVTSDPTPDSAASAPSSSGAAPTEAEAVDGPVVSTNEVLATAEADQPERTAPASTSADDSAVVVEAVSDEIATEPAAPADGSSAEAVPDVAADGEVPEPIVDAAQVDVAHDRNADTEVPATTTQPQTTSTPPRTAAPTVDTAGGQADGDPPAETAAPPVDVAPSGETDRAKPVVAPLANSASADGGDSAMLDGGPDGPSLVSEVRAADPKTAANPSARLAEQVAVRELFDRIDRQRLLRDGTLEFDISTERYGVLRVGAVDGGDGVQLSLQGDGASPQDLADLAEDLRRAFAEDGDDRSSVDVKDGSHRGTGAPEQHEFGASNSPFHSDESVDPARPLSSGMTGLDLRL